MVSDVILSHFRSVDPTMYALAMTYGNMIDLDSIPSSTPLKDLYESIVSQQLSVKAANTIWKRVCLVTDDIENPDSVLMADEDVLRGAGLSYQKISYIKSIAEHAKNGQLDFSAYPSFTDEDIIVRLMAVRGIGRWTAEMFLIFSLKRPNVFSVGDLGLRTAIEKNYSIARTELQKINDLSVPWAPYRSIASRLLWKSLE